MMHIGSQTKARMKKEINNQKEKRKQSEGKTTERTVRKPGK
jgi:hypothetical protein